MSLSLPNCLNISKGHHPIETNQSVLFFEIITHTFTADFEHGCSLSTWRLPRASSIMGRVPLHAGNPLHDNEHSLSRFKTVYYTWYAHPPVSVPHRPFRRLQSLKYPQTQPWCSINNPTLPVVLNKKWYVNGYHIPNHITYAMNRVHDITIHKHPAGPGTVLVKPHFFKKMCMALWRNDDFCIIETLKFWIHFLDGFAFYHSASSFSSAHLTLGILHLFLHRLILKNDSVLEVTKKTIACWKLQEER